MPASAVVLGAMVLMGWSRPRWVRGREKAPRDPPLRYLPYLILHLTGFIVLVALTAALFGERHPPPAHPGPLVVAWLFALTVTLTAWLGAMLPPRFLLALARARLGLLAGGLVLGAVAFEVGRLTQGLWLPLRKLTFVAASILLHATAHGVFSDPGTLTFGTGAFAVEIAPQCSGYEGVGLTWAFVLGALWLFRERFRFPRAFLLLIWGTFLPLVANVIRLVALVLIGTYVSPEIAAGGFHSYAGSILFCAVALGIVSWGLRAPSLAHARADDAAGPVARAEVASPGPYLLPFLVLTAASLVSRAFSADGAEPLRLVRPLAGAVALLAFLPRYRAMSWRVSWVAVPVGIGVAALWVGLAMLLPRVAGAAAAPPGMDLVVRAATAVLLVPMIEELAFRGFLARRISGADFEGVPPTRLSVAGVVVSSLAFGLLHQRQLLGTLAGLAYALMYRWRGRLGDAVVAHATTNAALLPAAWLLDIWDLWK
jgi:exosortase E/protease (VPEID-CTERM system)